MTIRPSKTEDLSNIRVIHEIDGVWGLNPEISITRSLRRYRERSISHGVEDGNDFTDRVITRRDRSLLVIRVRDHIGKIHVVENAFIGCEQDSDGSDGWVLMFVRIDPLELAIGKQALDKHGKMHSLSLTTTKRRMMRVVSPSQRDKGLAPASFARKMLPSEFVLLVPILYRLKPLLQTMMNKS